ncbi:beta-glucosidase 46-like isoform X3 [Tripterygium wilfordii]|uniref:beta-glucosidase 46-like isoform X3 n=1 Tax=Tripterygium wilfordii TaxID=458696 RepID=UPI0018F80773|nr:beta-glucosidase 46-like isoform X3 [Tripterygium wilfordii]
MGTSALSKLLFITNILLTLSLFVSPRLQTIEESFDPSPLPVNFLFGTASSSYQFEGAYLDDGKGLSNWDVFAHKPGVIIDGSNGDVALDHYHRYLEDIDLMDSLGVNSYRFSISWARILPKGRFGDVNEAGINFYNELIDALLLKGIEPFVTLTHYDIPQELEERYGSWLSPNLQEDFVYFADICFRSFGGRVKYWVTFNEPNLVALYGYRTAAVDIYRRKYQKEQGGIIGIVLLAIWFEPISNSTADKLASERAQSFLVNWFLDPIIYGKYPAEMIEVLGPMLPEFSGNDKEKLKNGLDFIGINHYSSFYVQDCLYSSCEPQLGTSKVAGSYGVASEKNGVPIGELTTLSWLNVYPQGMQRIITYVKERYNNIPMFITENGYGEVSYPNSTIEEHVNDFKRMEYMSEYLDALLSTIREGADVRGYFAWSLLDNFEWTSGYTVRFGLYYIDYSTLSRTPKLSATWYKEYIAKYIALKSQMPERYK